MLTKILGSNSQQPAYRHTCIGCVYTQVQFLREKFPSLDIEVDGGVSPTTIDVTLLILIIFFLFSVAILK